MDLIGAWKKSSVNARLNLIWGLLTLLPFIYMIITLNSNFVPEYALEWLEMNLLIYAFGFIMLLAAIHPQASMPLAYKIIVPLAWAAITIGSFFLFKKIKAKPAWAYTLWTFILSALYLGLILLMIFGSPFG